jgi:hypothetical protein
MMKKVWPVLLAVVLVFGLAVLGCGSSGSGNGPEVPGEGPEGNFDDLWDDQWVEGASVEGPKSIALDDNFEYGAGYQVTYGWTKLLNADIKNFDVYQLEIDFTVSRNLEDDLQWVLVDTSPTWGTNQYWGPLSRYKTVVNGQDEEDPTAPPSPDDPDGPIVPKGEGFTTTDTISYVGRVLVTPHDAPKASSYLVFTTKGEGTKGGKNSGVKGPVTLNFTKFKITKLAWGEAGEIPEIPDEGNLGLPAYNRGGSAPNFNGEEVGGESQAVWMIDGDMYDTMVIYGTKLVVTFENEIAGGMQIIWQDKTSWGWNQNDILTDTGAGDPSKGTSISEDKKTITIDLSLALKDYDKPTTGFLDKTAEAQGVKLILAYYTGENKMHGLKVVKADLVPAEVSNAFVPVTEIEYGGSTNAQVGVPLTLTATVRPGNATNKTIVWTATNGTISEGNKFTATAAGAATVTATIVNGLTETTNFTKTINITVTTPAAVVPNYSPDWTTLELAGQSWANNKPTATAIDASGTKIGYTLEWSDAGSADYDNVYAFFKVTFASGVTLADYDTVTFDYEGFSGDIGHKKIGLYAKATKFASESMASGYLVSNNPDIEISKVGDGKGAETVTLTIDKSKAAAVTGNEIYVSIFTNVSKGDDPDFTKYSIKNVVFSKD